jgi:hypothetical protein
MRKLFALSLGALWSLLACEEGPTTKAVPSVDDMRRVEEATHLKFPARAHVLMWAAGGRMDAYVRMKLDMPAVDWQAFIAASPFRDQPLREDAPASLGADRGEWVPGQVAHLLRGQIWLPGNESLNLGADMSRPEVVVVYIRWFEI